MTDSNSIYQKELESQIIRHDTEIRSIVDTLQSITTKLSRVEEAVVHSNRTNWGTLAGWAGVVVMIMSLIGHGYIRDLIRIAETQQLAVGEFHQHELLPGHASVVSDVSALKETVQTMDSTMTRQMGLRDEIVRGEIDRLDTILQREMRLLDNSQEVAVAHLKEMFMGLRDDLVEIRGLTVSNAALLTQIHQVQDRLTNITSRLRVLETGK